VALIELAMFIEAMACSRPVKRPSPRDSRAVTVDQMLTTTGPEAG